MMSFVYKVMWVAADAVLVFAAKAEDWAWFRYMEIDKKPIEAGE